MDRRRRDPHRLVEWERCENGASARKRRPKSSASRTAKSSLKRTMTKFVQERGVRHRAPGLQCLDDPPCAPPHPDNLLDQRTSKSCVGEAPLAYSNYGAPDLV
jgi:hypothetical protein